jgi:hypothetical protein
MILNKALLLALFAMFSLVAGNPGTVRNKRNLDKKEDPHKKGDLVPSKPPISVKRTTGENGDPDELQVVADVITCKKGSDECKKRTGGEVTKEEFAKKLVDGMLGKLEEDEKQGHRNLYTYCYWYYYCDCCWCYYYYECW